MANGLYAKGRQKFLEGGIAWLTDTIKLVLVDTALYTPNLATHEFLSDIPAGARVATSPAFTGKTSTNGVADSDNVVLPTVTGPQSEGLAIIKDTGNPLSSPLIAWFDSATGLPATPGGGNITIQWDDGPNKIFML